MAATPISLQAPVQGSRLGLWVDFLELLTGLALAGFIVTHLFFDSLIIFGAKAFDAVSGFLDATGLSFIAGPIIAILLLAHLVLAGRRIPNQAADMRKTWIQARNLNQVDTWLWLFQVVSGMLILAMAFYHLAIVLPGLYADGHIKAITAAARVQRHWHLVFFYLLFVPLCVFHAAVGVYRILVKWGWWPRELYKKWIYVAALGFSVWSLIGLFVLRFAIKGVAR